MQARLLVARAVEHVEKLSEIANNKQLQNIPAQLLTDSQKGNLKVQLGAAGDSALLGWLNIDIVGTRAIRTKPGPRPVELSMSIKDTIEKAVEKYLEEDKMYRKKITPTGDLSWYIKWVSSVIILFGMVFTSANMLPYNLWFHLIGVAGWGVVGFLWHDRALMILNGIALFIFASGLTKFYMGI